MEIKKNPKYDLEKKKGIFVEIGYIVVLVILLAAFQWRQTDETVSSLGELGDADVEEEIIPITRQEEVKPPPPPPPKVVEVLNIVNDDVEVDDELDIEETEADQETEVEPVVQEEEEETEEVFNFYVLEDKPKFPGGDIGLQKWIVQHTKYPEIAKENGITGKVFVQFVIGKDGKVTDVKLLRGVDPALDKEAIRVIKSLPAWTPGKQRGKPVKVSFQVPINFTLY